MRNESGHREFKATEDSNAYAGKTNTSCKMDR
jgi:hypothetical protein